MQDISVIEKKTCIRDVLKNIAVKKFQDYPREICRLLSLMYIYLQVLSILPFFSSFYMLGSCRLYKES